MVIKKDKKLTQGFETFCTCVEPPESGYVSVPDTTGGSQGIARFFLFFLRDRFEAIGLEECQTKVLSPKQRQPFNRKYQPVFLSLIRELTVASQL